MLSIYHCKKQEENILYFKIQFKKTVKCLALKFHAFILEEYYFGCFNLIDKFQNYPKMTLSYLHFLT